MDQISISPVKHKNKVISTKTSIRSTDRTSILNFVMSYIRVLLKAYLKIQNSAINKTVIPV